MTPPNISEKAPDKCDLCNLDKLTEWHHEDEEIIVFDCVSCHVLQVICKEHTMNPPTGIRIKMRKALVKAARSVYGHDNFYIDKNQRKILDHIHWHARKMFS